ncbi:MAG: hypothetical protein HZA49_09455 [Planctomycetes bacterium]|nr:hypothetical protein [Planctomycetota bacterium]
MMVLMIAVVGFLTGCAGGPATNMAVSPGEIKVSFFQLTQGRSAKEPIGIYVAMISGERNVKSGLKLNEIFEQVNTPRVMVVDDETAGELFKFINHEEFFALPETTPAQFNINDLKRTDFFTKVINVDINGVAYSVCYDNLPQPLKEKFNRIQQAIFLFMTAAQPKAAIEVQDWKELLPEGIQK